MVCGRTCRLVMLVLLIIGISFVDGKEQHYNNEEHDLLCDVLKAAVGLWEKSKSRSGPLRSALAQAIFGEDERVEEPTNLKFPDAYNSADYRLDWCGDCDDTNGLYPGKSIPHDLICLCTVGGDGAPFSHGGETLCGEGPDGIGGAGCKPASGRGGGTGKGWDDAKNGKDQLEKTWTAIVASCLQNRNRGNLKAALENFTRHLNDKKRLGGKEDDCGGYRNANICVSYANCRDTNGYPVWWKELREALLSEESKAATSSAGSASGPAAWRKSTGTSMNSGARSNTGKGYDGEGAGQGPATKNGPDVDPYSPIASESSKSSRETSNGGGGNFGFFRLIGTSKFNHLNWLLFSGLI